MDADLDTLLIALYVELTDRIIPSLHRRPDSPGAPPAVTDAEVVCLAVAQAHLGFGKERKWLRAAGGLVGHLFPRLLSQSEYNRRVRSLSGLMDAAARWLAGHCPSAYDTVRLLDGTKIICGASRKTAKRSNLAGWAGYGFDRSHHLFYWGMKLMLQTCPDGLITGWILVNPKMFGEAQATAMMLAVPANCPPPGTAFVTDKGLRSSALKNGMALMGYDLIRPASHGEPDNGLFPNWLRQRIEAINETLKGQLGIERPGAHERDGLVARVIQRILALNAAIWHNWNTGAFSKRSITAYDHCPA
jgi:hypothetical protein